MNDILLTANPPVKPDFTLSSGNCIFENQIGFKTEPKDISVSLGSFNVNSFYAGYPFSKLLQIYSVSNFKEISIFISENKFLETALLEIENAIRDEFPCEELRLEFYEDAEGELSDELAIFIITNEEPAVALAKLDLFDESFWSKNMDKYEDFVTVNLEYQ